MIVFHEGLPRSGKSYEACVMHILPAVMNGRRVVTNIEGINHEKFSELTHIPLLDIRDLLVCIYSTDLDDQKRLFLEESGKDALVVMDEVQNLFPSERSKLPPEWNRYISEHGHDGLDIVLMGQDRRDCHSMWRRRIQRVITFNKLSAVGRDNSYRWECLEATRPEKFKKVTGGVRPYDPKYFGLYQSHTVGTENKDVYVDKRANVLNNKSLRWGIAGAIAASIWSLSFLYEFFTPGTETANSVAGVEAPKVPSSPMPVFNFTELRKELPREEKSEPVEEGPPPPIDVFDQFAQQYRLRLAAVLVGLDKKALLARVDVLDASYHVQEQFSVAGLRDMGWEVTYRDSGLYIAKQGVTHIARAWPIDKFGRVDNDTVARL